MINHREAALFHQSLSKGVLPRAASQIEVQVFGNSQDKAIRFGERECSIQRRHQKVMEECLSPFVTKHPKLREKLGAAAVRLAELIKYGSAGTIECLVDDETAHFFFLEMNARLQVEHGITEMCYKADLVELTFKASRHTIARERWPRQILSRKSSTKEARRCNYRSSSVC
jgi:urea carboxylase